MWFVTAISTSITHSIYKFTAILYKALYYDGPKDVLISNNFILINRKWSFEEFSFNASKYASQFGISLTDQEKTKLCYSVKTMEELFNR